MGVIMRQESALLPPVKWYTSRVNGRAPACGNTGGVAILETCVNRENDMPQHTRPSTTRARKRGRKPTDIAVRLWAKIDRRGDDECWLWTAGIDRNGYARIRFRGTSKIAHRIVWELTHGTIPRGLGVCHTCDARYPKGDITYRRCCNPHHHFLGTHDDNMRDMAAKGRHGLHKPRAILTPELVRALRMDAMVLSRASIAAKYNTSVGNVCNIIARRSWQDVS
jgi:hypothetical protein